MLTLCNLETGRGRREMVIGSSVVGEPVIHFRLNNDKWVCYAGGQNLNWADGNSLRSIRDGEIDWHNSRIEIKPRRGFVVGDGVERVQIALYSQQSIRVNIDKVDYGIYAGNKIYKPFVNRGDIKASLLSRLHNAFSKDVTGFAVEGLVFEQINSMSVNEFIRASGYFNLLN